MYCVMKVKLKIYLCGLVRLLNPQDNSHAESDHQSFPHQKTFPRSYKNAQLKGLEEFRVRKT